MGFGEPVGNSPLGTSRKRHDANAGLGECVPEFGAGRAVEGVEHDGEPRELARLHAGGIERVVDVLGRRIRGEKQLAACDHGKRFVRVIDLADLGEPAERTAVEADRLHGRHGELDADVLGRIVRRGDRQAHRLGMANRRAEREEVSLRRAERIAAGDDAEAHPHRRVDADLQEPRAAEPGVARECHGVDAEQAAVGQRRLEQPRHLGSSKSSTSQRAS